MKSSTEYSTGSHIDFNTFVPSGKLPLGCLDRHGTVVATVLKHGSNVFTGEEPRCNNMLYTGIPEVNCILEFKYQNSRIYTNIQITIVEYETKNIHI